MNKIPPSNALQNAAFWLEAYSGKDRDIKEGCLLVAAWLKRRAKSLEQQEIIRTLSREFGIISQEVKDYIDREIKKEMEEEK